LILFPQGIFAHQKPPSIGWFGKNSNNPSLQPRNFPNRSIPMERPFSQACNILESAVADKTLLAASICVQSHDWKGVRHFGLANSPAPKSATPNHPKPVACSAFLLGSITKPIVITAVVALLAEKNISLDEPATKYLTEFPRNPFETIRIRHLLTHTCGLPDQLPNNADLRSRHRPLEDFVASCSKLPTAFIPGSAYEYSSMGILLAAEIAQRISGNSMIELVQQRVFNPLNMRCSALGLGQLPQRCLMPCQVEFGAPEAGGGSSDSANWNWNSPYWRALGAPWGGAHCSAEDVAKLLDTLLHSDDRLMPASAQRQLITNQNPAPLESRGLGFDVDMRSSGVKISTQSFGHTGSTGTIAWADPSTDRICVVLTSLPTRAMPQGSHPLQLASSTIAEAP
jgi:CubicO group peptidase (beta-lactamase class C family)